MLKGDLVLIDGKISTIFKRIYTVRVKMGVIPAVHIVSGKTQFKSE